MRSIVAGSSGSAASGPGTQGTLSRHHRALCRDLVAHGRNRGRGRTDEDQPRLFYSVGEGSVLGQKTVTGMNGARTGEMCCQKDGILIEIALGGTRRADAEKAVCGLAVRRFPVGLGADGDRLQAELAAGALDPDCDLATIGDQNGIEAA